MLLVGRRNGGIYKFVSIPFLPPTFGCKKHAGLFNSHHTFTIIALVSNLWRQVYFSFNRYAHVPPTWIFLCFAQKKCMFVLVLFHYKFLVMVQNNKSVMSFKNLQFYLNSDRGKRGTNAGT